LTHPAIRDLFNRLGRHPAFQELVRAFLATREGDTAPRVGRPAWADRMGLRMGLRMDRRMGRP
jgi:hypothetical protein